MQTQEKTLPIALEAEKGLLSIIMFYPYVMSDIAALVEAKDFYRADHRAIFTALTTLYAKRDALDAVMVSNELARKDITTINNRPAFDFLLDLQNYEPSSMNAESYARRIAFTAELRTLIKIAGQIAGFAYNEDDQAMEKAEELILRSRRQGYSEFVSVGEYMPAYIKRLEQLAAHEGNVRGVPTGYTSLDRVLGGLQPGALYVPAARPGVGKTTLCQNFTYNAAIKYHKKIAFFSLEMGLDALMDRFVSMHSKIDTQQLRRGELSDHAATLVKTQDDFERLGIYLNYTPGITITSLKSIARRLVARHSIDMIVVDYLQLLKATIDGKRVTPREMEVAEIARELKQLAGELNVPVVAPAQINRAVENRTATKDEDTDLTYRMPVLADLRESGEIEQSADVVMFLAQSEEKQEHVRLNVAKHRNGPTGEMDLYFVGSETRFYSMGEQD